MEQKVFGVREIPKKGKIIQTATIKVEIKLEKIHAEICC